MRLSPEKQGKCSVYEKLRKHGEDFAQHFLCEKRYKERWNRRMGASSSYQTVISNMLCT